MKIFNKTPFLIADISINLFDFADREKISYLESAKFLIEEAKSCGVDAVMFQSYTVENLLSRDESAFRDLGINSINSYYDSIKRYDKFGVGEFRELAMFCREIGIVFLATPHDFESADYLDDFMDFYKIGSSDLTNIPFIEYIARKNKPILLATGGATLVEIRNAIKAIEDVSTCDVVIMHSVLSFPTKYEDANLLMIRDLARNFPDYEIGYSDHTKPDENMMVLTTAFNYGATVIEKHFTFDKGLEGLDSSFAMDGDDVITFKKNLLFLSRIKGFMNKQPLIYESRARRELRKSIVANADIKKGDIIKEEDITFKRPGTGISPSQIGDVVGKEACRNISKDSLIYFDFIKK